MNDELVAGIAVCPFCGTRNKLILKKDSYESYMAGALIQDAFPDMDPETRELIKTGICESCWPSD
jgi:hypothetical protein